MSPLTGEKGCSHVPKPASNAGEKWEDAQFDGGGPAADAFCVNLT